jgi:hypothetical protein
LSESGGCNEGRSQIHRASGSRHLEIPLEVRLLIRFESGPDYKRVVPLRKEVLIKKEVVKSNNMLTTQRTSHPQLLVNFGTRTEDVGLSKIQFRHAGSRMPKSW